MSTAGVQATSSREEALLERMGLGDLKNLGSAEGAGVRDLFPDEPPATTAPSIALVAPKPFAQNDPKAALRDTVTSVQHGNSVESVAAAGTRHVQVPKQPLQPGEVLEAAPWSAKRAPPAEGPATSAWAGAPPASPAPGWLHLTNLRVLWEPEHVDVRASIDAPTLEAVGVPLQAIGRFFKQKSELHAELLVEVHLKYDACSALRVWLSAAAYAQLLDGVRRHLRVPSGPTDVRANVLGGYAVARGRALAAQPPPPHLSGGGANVERRGVGAGWRLYPLVDEYHRMGLNNPLSHWRLTEINARYSLCTTYPTLLAVPRCMSDDDLEKAAAFRSGRRLPVLCWKDPFGVGTICRCAQPLVGAVGKTCKQDERLLQAIAETNPFVEYLQIVDCRPKLNADVNRARGKGYERPQDYPNTQIAFMGIENIHAMRASLKAFLALMKPRSPHHAFAHGREDREEQGWLGELEKSGWIEHVRGVLRAAVTVTRHVHIGRSSVLVHCSDGWDRTAQVTAIAQLLLDGSFRSRDGFQRLVQKEWLDFGHQFALRLGSLAPLEKGTHSPSDEQLSPVFLQFVECVWHLCQQMPRAFEFNTSYLAALLHHALACETGTFLCNCERQRVALELPALTASAWDMLGGEEFRNFEYEPSGDVLLPDVSASTLRPWSAYYCRAGRRLRDEPLQLAEARCAALANENSQLREALRRLGPSKAADDGEAVAVVPAVETSPGVAQAQPRLEVHEAHVEVHALAHQGAALLCEEEEFGSAPDASSSVEDDDE